jgi:hypothetical protein
MITLVMGMIPIRDETADAASFPAWHPSGMRVI